MGDKAIAMKRKDVWVSAEAPQATAPAPATRPAPTVELVSGKVLDNLWGGVGVAVALSAGYALVRIALANLGMMPLPSLVDVAWALVAFVLVGALAFGMLTAWRASLDERERQGELDTLRDNEAAMLADIDEMEQEIAEYRKLYENAVSDLAEARAALHQAMGRNSDKYRAPEDDPVAPSVERDAQFLLQLMHAGQPAGWQSVTKTYNDWNRKKWEAARDLLEAADVVRTVGNQTKPVESTYQASVGKLGAYCHSEWDS